jgi:DNA-binding LacI/PurR family transcriptional regulator
MAAGHLLDRGVRTLAYVGGPTGLTFSAQRRDGVQDALRRHRLSAAALLEVTGDLTMEGGERAVEGLLASRPRAPFDGVFAANDRMAIGVLRALRRRGLRVPQDVQVVGFDDIEAAAWVDPPLTTVALPAFEMGRQAAELLLRLTGGERPRRRTLMLEPALVVRATTRAGNERTTTR